MALQGNFFDYFIVFWAGVLVSFTPCVYPVMPITASFIAGFNTKGTKLMGFLISLVYVLGLAYAGQEVDDLPLEPHDQRLDAILTETGFIEVDKKAR